MKKKFIIIMTILFSGLFIQCSSTDKTTRKPYPPNNVKSINTSGDDLGPFQNPENEAADCAPCSKEFSDGGDVKPSGFYIHDIMQSFMPEAEEEQKDFAYYVINNAESISFLGENEGFFSISHLPDFVSAENLQLPLSLPFEGSFGGTDIYEFHKEGEKYIIKNLEKNSNTMFWDSHPFAIKDSNCNVLLIWSSDRKSPYSYIIDANGKEKKIGNTDLYYNFRDKNGSWGNPRSMSEISPQINTEFNEETAFIFCLCHQTKLFFASNRTMPEDPNDYDIYSIEMKIDFDSKTLSVSDGAKAVLLPKGKDMINTSAKEFFPFVSSPYEENSPQKYIYVSSDRYTDEKSKYEGAGKFDIYQFELNGYDCKPPSIYYDYAILDSLNPRNTVKAPIAALYEIDENGNEKEIDVKKGPTGSFRLRPWKKYIIKGGSEYDKIICDNNKDSVIWHYNIREIKWLGKDTVDTYTNLEYDQVITRGKTRRRDTVYTVTVSPEEFGALQTDRSKRILSAIEDGDNFILEIKERLVDRIYAPVDTLSRTKRINVKKTIDVYDTLYTKSSENNLHISSKTSQKPIYFGKLREDAYIHDTIFIWPRYYKYPPCEWKYEKHETDYRRNVPYFQTCFWEVNTSKNLEEHIRLLNRGSSRLGGASFIELNPTNQYFGFRRVGIPAGRYYSRLFKYRRFAEMVDSNIHDMANEIGEVILPEFHAYDTLTGNNNKLIIMIDAYSDSRPIGGETARYIAKKGECVDYLAISYDTSAYRIKNIYPVHIEPDASLRGENNDTLSKLRVYFGFSEILKKLEEYDLFNEYLDDGKVLLPHLAKTKGDFWEKFNKSKIIFMIEGKQYDSTVTPIHSGYIGREGDFNILDTVRRINLVAQRVAVSGRNLYRPGCCKKTSRPSIYRGNKPIDRKLEKKAAKSFLILFDSFETKDDAKAYIDLLKENGLDGLKVRKSIKDAKNLFEVVSGSFKSMQLAQEYIVRAGKILESLGKESNLKIEM